MKKTSFSVMTYNIRSLLSKKRQDRVFEKLNCAKEMPDILCLQEAFRGKEKEFDFSILAKHYPHVAFGQNSTFFRGILGNAVLSRFPIVSWENYDLSIKGREPRGCLKTTIALPTGQNLYLLVLHLGLRHFERQEQFRFLSNYLEQMSHAVPLLVSGDFNDWRYALHSLTYRNISLFDAHEIYTGSLARTFPAFCPVLPLDRIYFSGVTLKRTEIWKKTWRTTSDHLPLSAQFEL
jgi:endonuclease/exonuclease/phosphatase family metal-dependent hydrolase